VGDSLVSRSAEEHGLLERVRGQIAHAFPTRTFEVVNAGVSGDRIVDIRNRLQRDVVALHPDVVVLYWDSDVSDVDERKLSSEEVSRLRRAYERDLGQVLGGLLAAGAQVLVAGPTVIGERPHGHNPKDGQLDAYAEINRSLASDLHALYVPTRHAALRWLRHHPVAKGSKGTLTEDGEHLSALGVSVVADELVRALSVALRRTGPLGAAP
jgi:lysophospholipase L1-like esterase